MCIKGSRKHENKSVGNGMGRQKRWENWDAENAKRKRENRMKVTDVRHPFKASTT